MLTAKRLSGAVAAALLIVLNLQAGAAMADGGVECPPLAGDCDVHAGGGGSAGGGSNGGGGGTGGEGSNGGSGGAVCRIDGNVVPCYRSDVGWFNPADRCYWLVMKPQPPADDPSWKIATGGGPKASSDTGALYNVTCLAKGAELMGGTTFSTTPPPGYGGMVDPAVIAQNMVSSMGLLGADIGTAPKQGGTSLVGLPVWLWNNTSAKTWGPTGAQASAGGVTVTATAHVDRIIWATGDGSSVTCKGPGKPYQPSYGASAPDCGHTYTQPGTYTITATSKWVVDWTATTGQGGQILVDRTSTATVAMAEAQALNTQ